jgi:hypothetical protein
MSYIDTSNEDGLADKPGVARIIWHGTAQHDGLERDISQGDRAFCGRRQRPFDVRGSTRTKEDDKGAPGHGRRLHIVYVPVLWVATKGRNTQIDRQATTADGTGRKPNCCWWWLRRRDWATESESVSWPSSRGTYIARGMPNIDSVQDDTVGVPYGTTVLFFAESIGDVHMTHTHRGVLRCGSAGYEAYEQYRLHSARNSEMLWSIICASHKRHK